MNILVVDDEEIIVEGITHHISGMSDIQPQVVGVTSAAEAIETMKLFRPDLLITDIRMQEMDGLTLIEQAEKQCLCQRFMIITAYENFEYAKRALDFHVMGYIVKPIDWDVLDERLRQLYKELSSQQEAKHTIEEYEHLFRHIFAADLSPGMKKIVRYIQKNYTKDLSLVQLSFFTGLSESYLCILFRNELGITFLDYVNELRLHAAMKELLEHPNRSVREVAILVGYHSERQLFRLFNMSLNMTPQQFRKQNS